VGQGGGGSVMKKKNIAVVPRRYRLPHRIFGVKEDGAGRGAASRREELLLGPNDRLSVDGLHLEEKQARVASFAVRHFKSGEKNDLRNFLKRSIVEPYLTSPGPLSFCCPLFVGPCGFPGVHTAANQPPGLRAPRPLRRRGQGAG